MDVSFVIFDWDGTLSDSKSKIVACLRSTLAALDVPAGTDDELASVIGLSLDDVGRALIASADDPTVKAFTTQYREQWFAAGPPSTELFPGVPETLVKLQERGVPLAVATGKNRAGLDRELGANGIGQHFIATRTADETRSKPDPQMLHELLEEVGVAAEQAVLVGDSHWDLQMANAAGVRAIAVSYGAQPIDRLLQYSPWAHIDAIEELLGRI
ncbi:MAG: HAD family hydrolase [Nannocystales bacterium]